MKKNRKNHWKKSCANFFDKYIFFFFDFFSENVLKTLLRGRETTRKKYRIVFEKFTFFEKKSKKSLEKKNCAKFFEKFIIFYFFWVFRRTCPKNSSKGTRNNQEKISTIFWEMLKIHILNQKNCWKKKLFEIFWQI